jgi:hypothetical protein
VSYLNGEGKITYIDLKESKNKINPKDNSLTVNLKFNKSGYYSYDFSFIINERSIIFFNETYFLLN